MDNRFLTRKFFFSVKKVNVVKPQYVYSILFKTDSTDEQQTHRS